MQKAPVLPNDTLLVGFDFTHGDDNRILIVGRKVNNVLEVVNAFQGDEAYDIYQRLITIKNSIHKEEPYEQQNRNP